MTLPVGMKFSIYQQFALMIAYPTTGRPRETHQGALNALEKAARALQNRS